jgi:23S rRNA (pseudouridine1915-N3)-methyltransferase
MKFALLTVTSKNEPWLTEARAVYLKKLRPFFPFEILELPPAKLDRASKQQKKDLESKQILAALSGDDCVFVFDERAKSMDSIQFSKKLETALNGGKKRIVFVVGGAFGFSDDVLQRADLKISFSPMTMNHLVAQVVALEQIYRGLTILKNLPYHNA